MKHVITSLSFLITIIFGQYYEIGSLISMEHQAVELNVCANDTGPFSLNNFNGANNDGDYHVIWIIFFTSWCTYCQAEIPAIVDMYNQFNDQGLIILSIGRQWNHPYNCQGWADLGLLNPVLDDDTTTVWSWFGLGYVPQSIIIDHTMTVRYNDLGFDAAETAAIISTLLNEMSTVNIAENEPIPNQFEITPPFPNPFNARISWTLELERDSYVEANIIDLSGKIIYKITEQNLRAGSHTFSWYDNEVSSGVYFLDVATPFQRKTHKIILLK